MAFPFFLLCCWDECLPVSHSHMSEAFPRQNFSSPGSEFNCTLLGLHTHAQLKGEFYKTLALSMKLVFSSLPHFISAAHKLTRWPDGSRPAVWRLCSDVCPSSGTVGLQGSCPFSLKWSLQFTSTAVFPVLHIRHILALPDLKMCADVNEHEVTPHYLNLHFPDSNWLY